MSWFTRSGFSIGNACDVPGTTASCARGSSARKATVHSDHERRAPAKQWNPRIVRRYL